MENSGKFNFIKIERIRIKNFSLYSKSNDSSSIKEVINDGVYCLAGANGLGKTTFLNIINYVLTGLVLESNKEVFSPFKIEEKNKVYTDNYFNGRIIKKDEAEVEIKFKINNTYYKICRDFNDRKALKNLEIYDDKNNSLYNLNDQTPKELSEIYEKQLTKDMGIGNFEYFVFVQLYILTFDENRRMIFWDKRAAMYALSIAFNYDVSDTDRISKLKTDMQNLESYGRNTRWQATQIKKEMEVLLNSQNQSELINFNELKKEHDTLVENVEKTESILKNIEIEYDTLLKQQNIINSELLQVRTQFKKLFSQYSEPRSKLLNNQYIRYSKKQSECFLCGATGHHIIKHITQNLQKDKCPICDTKINEEISTEQDELLTQIEETDIKIEKMNSNLENLIFESEAKKVELEKAEYEYYISKEKLEKFEKENTQIKFDKTGDIPTDTLIEQYKERYEQEDKKAKGYYKARDKLLPEYKNLLKKVNDAYEEAEEYFVPLFQEIAKSFIGLDLNIYSETEGKDLYFKFDLMGRSRTTSYQLSESQRFFLDIALRMALAIYMSKQNNESTMLIDTPEGSLDIAYESRVGKMFANFVTKYHQNIIMTANINASQLLVSLADKCSKENMSFKRMLDWTDLNEIQKEGEHLFEDVYNNIEKELRK